MKYWINNKQKQDKIIAITEKVIYTSSPSESDFIEFRKELQLGKLPKRLSGIKFSRIRKIEFEDEKPKFEIHYDKKDILDIQVSNPQVKEEIKATLEKVGPQVLERTTSKRSLFEKGYKNLVGILITSFITYYAFDIALNLKQGWEYETAGLGGILVGIAEITGELGVLTIGGIILTIIIINLVSKIKNNALVDRFKYK
jgi:hypothetical protein